MTMKQIEEKYKTDADFKSDWELNRDCVVTVFIEEHMHANRFQDVCLVCCHVWVGWHALAVGACV